MNTTLLSRLQVDDGGVMAGFCFSYKRVTELSLPSISRPELLISPLLFCKSRIPLERQTFFKLHGHTEQTDLV